MFEDVHTYFYENVLTSYKEYEDRRLESKTGLSIDLRKALIAATSLYHFREHLPNKFKKSREEFVKLCTDYDLLGDVVNISKHKKLTKHWKYLNSPDSIKEIVVITKFRDRQGEYFYKEKIISVQLTDGAERDLFDVLTNVLNMWYEYLYKIKMLPKQYHKFVHKKVFPLRRHECSGNTLDIEAMKGVGFRHMVRLQEYNYKANKVEPINLEKAKIQMRIYKPNYEVSLKLIHKQTKKEVNIPIKLSEEDMFNIHGLKTDLEIKRYLIELSRKQKLLKVDKDIDKIISEIELSKTDD